MFARIAAALLLLIGCAHAQDAVGVHTFSTHFRTPTDHCHPNNVNVGGFYRHDGWEIGDYLNSHCANTLYGGHLFEGSDYQFGPLPPLRPAFFLGVATGYKFHGLPITPAETASVSWPLIDSWRGRVEYTRDPRASRAGVMHLRLEHPF